MNPRGVSSPRLQPSQTQLLAPGCARLFWMERHVLRPPPPPAIIARPSGTPRQRGPASCDEGPGAKRLRLGPLAPLPSAALVAKNRQVLRPPRSLLTLAPELTKLMMHRVRPSTQEAYTVVLLMLAGWLRVRILPAWSAEIWDTVLCEFFEHLFDLGHNLSTASRAAAALLWALPRLGSPFRRVLPCASHALRGWRLLRPPASRPPIPWQVAAGIAMEMLRTGALTAGLLTVAMLFAYLRPSEALALEVRHVVLPRDSSTGTTRFLTLVIFPLENETPGKTGEFDHSVPLDLEEHLWLVQALKLWVRGRSPGDLLFDLTYETFLSWFKATAARCRLQALAPMPYVLRHGGALHDRGSRQRSLTGIQRRGNWRSWASVRRYEKSVRLGLQLQKLPADVLLQRERQRSSVGASSVNACARLGRRPGLELGKSL